MSKERRKKNLKQSQKGLHKNIKPDIWKRTGYVPCQRLRSEINREGYRARMNQSEGKGTGRSEGSNKALKKLAGI